MSTEISISIASSMPAVKRYSAKQKLSEGQFSEIATIVKMWVKAILKPACLDKNSELSWETAIAKKYMESEWDLCMRDVFAAMKLPVRQSYKIYEALSDLDSMIYKVLYPFPVELEYGRDKMLAAETAAAKPLTDEQLRMIGRTPLVAPAAPATTPTLPPRSITPPSNGFFSRFGTR